MIFVMLNVILMLRGEGVRGRDINCGRCEKFSRKKVISIFNVTLRRREGGM